MPCYTITTTNVELGKVNHTLFLKTLIALGLNPQVSIRNGVTTIRLSTGETFNAATGMLTTNNPKPNERVAEIKRAYSHTIVQTQAKRMGWQVKQLDESRYEVIRR